jgi:hypothetical protein
MVEKRHQQDDLLVPFLFDDLILYFTNLIPLHLFYYLQADQMFRYLHSRVNFTINALSYQFEKNAIGRWVLDVLRIFWDLVKIMVPILLVVRGIELLGWISVYTT